MMGDLAAGFFFVLFCFTVMLNTENSLSHQAFIQELDGVCSSPKWKNVSVTQKMLHLLLPFTNPAMCHRI